MGNAIDALCQRLRSNKARDSLVNRMIQIFVRLFSGRIVLERVGKRCEIGRICFYFKAIFKDKKQVVFYFDPSCRATMDDSSKDIDVYAASFRHPELATRTDAKLDAEKSEKI